MVEPNRGISTSLLVLFFLLFLFFGFIYGQNFIEGAYGACVFTLGPGESLAPLKSGYVSACFLVTLPVFIEEAL